MVCAALALPGFPGRAAEQAGRKGRAARLQAPAPDRADLAYGSHPNHRLDLWLAKSGKPSPLLVFIHGGGFAGGDKSAVGARNIRGCIAGGVSLASINYRFGTEAPIQDILRDAARAVQFLRFKAGEYNLDKTRVAAMGGSAGAGTSLWLAFHDDLADPRNADPALRESTRLVAAAAIATKATYDILRWPDVLGDPGIARYAALSDYPAFYGLKTMEELQGENGRRIRADVDMLALISRDDPPVFLASSNRIAVLDSRNAVNHSPKHAIAVKRRCDEAGVEAVLEITEEGGGEQAAANPLPFLLKRLAARSAPVPRLPSQAF